MRIRRYRHEDRAAVLALHERHGKEFCLCDPEDALTAGTFLAEKDGQIVGVLSGKWVVESYLMVEPGLSTVRKWGAIQALVDAAMHEAERLGIAELYSCVAVEVKEAEKYARLLERFKGFAMDIRKRLICHPRVFCERPKSSAKMWEAA